MKYWYGALFYAEGRLLERQCKQRDSETGRINRYCIAFRTDDVLHSWLPIPSQMNISLLVIQ